MWPDACGFEPRRDDHLAIGDRTTGKPRVDSGMDLWRRGKTRVFSFAAPATRVRMLGEPTCGGATSAREAVSRQNMAGVSRFPSITCVAVETRLHPTGLARRRAGGFDSRGAHYRSMPTIPDEPWQPDAACGRM